MQGYEMDRGRASSPHPHPVCVLTIRDLHQDASSWGERTMGTEVESCSWSREDGIGTEVAGVGVWVNRGPFSPYATCIPIPYLRMETSIGIRRAARGALVRMEVHVHGGLWFSWKEGTHT